MKKFKEFKPLIKLLSEDRVKFIIASTIIFLVRLSEIFTGHLNGTALEAMTNFDLKNALIF